MSQRTDPPRAQLTGTQLDRIHRVLLAAYNRDELRRMVMVCMDADFDALVPDKAFSAQVFELVQWANRQGRVLELVQCAHQKNPGYAELLALFAEAQAWRTTGPLASNADMAGAADNATSTPPLTGSHHVFLAYSRKDSALMRQLRSDLLAAGISAWVDEADLEPGTPQWQQR